MVSELEVHSTMAAPTNFPSASASATQNPSVTQNPFLFLSNLPNYVSVKLNSTNYVLWNYQISAVLRGFMLYGFVDGTSVCPERFIRGDSGSLTENPAFSAWIAQDQALLAMINATLSPAALSYVIGQTTSRGVWLVLARRFVSVSRSNVLDLKLELHDVKKKNDSIDDYVQRIKSLRDDLAARSVFFSDEEILHITLRGLPADFHGFRTAIKTRSDPLPLEELHVLMLSEEKFIQENQDSLNDMPNMAMAMAAFRNFSYNSNKGKNVKQNYSSNNTNSHSNHNNGKGKAPMVSHEGSSSSFASGGFFPHNGGFLHPSDGFMQSTGGFMPNNGGFMSSNNGSVSNGGYLPSNGFLHNNNGGSYHNNGGSYPAQGNFSGQQASSSHNQGYHSNYKASSQLGSTGNNNKQFVSNGRPVCQICNVPGHVALDCYHRMDFSYQGRHPPARLAAMAATASPDTSSYWLTDSGATNHITAEMSNLAVNTEYSGTDQVAIGDGQGLPISHIGQTYGEGPLQRPE